MLENMNNSDYFWDDLGLNNFGVSWIEKWFVIRRILMIKKQKQCVRIFYL